MINKFKWRELINSQKKFQDFDEDDWEIVVDFFNHTVSKKISLTEKKQNIENSFEIVRNGVSKNLTLDDTLVKDGFSEYYPIFYFGKKTKMKYSWSFLLELAELKASSCNVFKEFFFLYLNYFEAVYSN